MFDPKAIDDIANRLANAMPPGLSHLKEDMERNFHAILQGALGKLDLVTREEFEVQKAVLTKTRTKLEDLEIRVAALERQLDQNPSDQAN
ncbi:ubiquinone biosynthesis accessory factor UbiK [Methylotuvimicrobium buryatense]|uniref:Ubiquinone biosynthesis accessory factor UbiK n=1 Tax=Methylotuvimicrobium buryatense TaxID=95641 RepID=A0A4P9UVD2_METBY|nr:accessory factor UbiK family protein [Methylotuvimicrobium buryatense]QCW84401.1 accessory factor UbiK family protein [Methylotuvimicrobium buryatense]